MLHILWYLLSCLFEDFPCPETAEILELAFETFISASFFADLSWKQTAAAIAERLAQLLRSPVHLARAYTRKASLSRLFGDTHLPPPKIIPPPAINERTNAWFGQLILSAAQELINKSTPTEHIISIFCGFRPLHPDRPSHQESLILLDT
ncbi:hypothetical protein SODALDRAFT_329721 [Sodiomyces alkalinus F11]|uniref:Uncharacterized protein n=1 Tax=Sodiomyces alkalinus (strain CBS 110278 / VKM F-3762 / F11) TaxID=1314773 RepID=A0A3N2PJW6_SODAK|nr:hypothetical protein SODALDRAFT_329721 [Sodiomyces alkalinus F11]ROT34606.1 hypothetical protein SODALDRAFT_329721 [Sodiomyces alkalinus F11]